ncbi:hypothetical protein L484_019683 [Morus notabilis]|uniref:Uncharacterized protein n=1 Tax=Morus notabilis TaxID=981085 RepID=W9QKE5_9ROSA|nr:hypothetical protein L484_019683 [Morus notabilis]
MAATRSWFRFPKGISAAEIDKTVAIRTKKIKLVAMWVDFILYADDSFIIFWLHGGLVIKGFERREF